MGRTTKVKEVKEDLLKLISIGFTYKEAIDSVGIDESTFYRWQKQGKVQKKGQYFEFYKELKKANLMAKKVHLSNIHKQAQGGQDIQKIREKIIEGKLIEREILKEKTQPIWQASAWILERRYPNEFGRNRVEISFDDSKPLPLFSEQKTPTDKEYKAMADKLEAEKDKNS